jgi:hypothetical protein
MTNKQIKVSSNVSGIKQQYIYRVKEIGGYFNAVTAQGAHIQKRACSSILMPYTAHTESHKHNQITHICAKYNRPLDADETITNVYPFSYKYKTSTRTLCLKKVDR